MKKSPIIQSVDRALNIYKLFIDNEQLSITEISKKIGLCKSVCFKLVITLEKNGFLKQDLNNKKYEVGQIAFDIGSQYLINNTGFKQLLLKVYSLFDKLVQETGCTSQLAILESSHDVFVRIIASSESSSIVKISATLGEKIPVNVSSAGKCLIAFSEDPKLLEKVISNEFVALTPYSIIGEKEFIQEISQVKIQGYAVSDNEWHIGVFSLAVPVFNVFNKCKAALLISHPSNNIEKIKVSDSVAILKKYADLLLYQV